MDNTSLLSEGINLMIFGVSFVFVFLTLLVLATSAMSWLVIKLEKKVGVLPEDGVPSPTAVINPEKHAHQSADETKKTDSNGHILPILTAAIHKFRSKK